MRIACMNIYCATTLLLKRWKEELWLAWKIAVIRSEINKFLSQCLCIKLTTRKLRYFFMWRVAEQVKNCLVIFTIIGRVLFHDVYFRLRRMCLETWNSCLLLSMFLNIQEDLMLVYRNKKRKHWNICLELLTDSLKTKDCIIFYLYTITYYYLLLSII